MKHSRIAAGLMACALFTLGACGSDNKSSSTLATTSTPAVTTPSTAAGADSPNDTVDSSDTADTVDTVGSSGTADTVDQSGTDDTMTDETFATEDTTPGPGDPGFKIPAGTSEKCVELYNSVMEAQGDGNFDDPAGVRQLGQIYEKIKSQAPELSAELDTVSQAMDDYATALEAYEGDPAAMTEDPGVLAAITALGSDDVQKASDAISSYLDKTCPTLAS